MTVQEGALLCGRYRLQQSVGRGGMADVYLAFDGKRQAPVAVKILREDLAEDPDFVRRFRHEAEALARLDHPNIVRFYAFEQDGLVAFIVMDYIAGTTLRRHLQERREPLEVRELTLILRDLCSALHYAHVNGFVHRDLKPGNVMLKRDGTALLTDFGIARAMEGATLTAAAMGTPAYMSPEQIKGDPVDARSDIYSLGVLLFEMATGRRPFTGDEPGLTQPGTTTRVQQAHLRLPPPELRSLNPKLPAAASAVIERALAKTPADRWPDVVSLRGAWEAAVGAASASGVSTAAVAPVRIPPSAAKRPLPGWTLALIAVAFLAIAAVLFLVFRAPRKDEIVAQVPPPTIAPIAAQTVTPIMIITSPPITGSIPKGGVVQVVTQVPSATTSLTPTLPAATATVRATLTPVPTVTLSASATRPTTIKPRPTLTPRPPPPVRTERFVTVSLRDVATNSTADGYVNPPLGEITLAGVRFSLGEGSSATTQAGPLPDNPQSIVLSVDVQNPEAVYLLLTGGDLYSRFAGQTVGRVRLVFADGRVHAVDLVAGQNLREWKLLGDVVAQSANPALAEVWRGGNRYDEGVSIIDMLTLAVPTDLQSNRLTRVEVIDLSIETVGDLDPAVNVLGATVAAKTGTSETTSGQGCRLSASVTSLPLWQQHSESLGCPVNEASQSDAVTERFEHGSMIWRKNNDMIYVLYDDGYWAAYPDISVDGALEPEGFQPPAGLYTPVRGFGATWRTHLGGTAARIGWATDAEYALPIEFQDFEQGLMLEMDGRVHLLGDRGRIWLAP